MFESNEVVWFILVWGEKEHTLRSIVLEDCSELMLSGNMLETFVDDDDFFDLLVLLEDCSELMFSGNMLGTFVDDDDFLDLLLSSIIFRSLRLSAGEST